jgi:hypothetical protein
MAKQKPGMTPEEQRKRFIDAAAKADGGQSPIDADERFDKLFRKIVPERTRPQ